MRNIEEFIKVIGRLYIFRKEFLERILSCINWNKKKCWIKEKRIKKKLMNWKNKFKFCKTNK